MKTVLGKTGLEVTRDGFGALPIQRASVEEAEKILNRALDAGINYFDTARAYSDSEEKIGRAISGRRDQFFIATKTMSGAAEGFWRDLETSLRNLKTAYIDVYQFHNPVDYPRPDDGTGLYEAMLEAKKQGKIRFIGITNHRLPVAEAALDSGLYDVLQFPFSYLSGEKDIALVRRAKETNTGFVCMKALSGGLITDIAAARAWLGNYPEAVPIWGIQRESELDALFDARGKPAVLSPEQEARIARDREELSGNFCRACGYCLPCPAEIDIPSCARMFLLLHRMPFQQFLTGRWEQEMAKIEDCRHCDHCKEHCPYGLDTPALLARSLKDYREFLAARRGAA